MGASVRPIPVTGRDLIARAVAPQSTQVGAEPWTGYRPGPIEQALTFPLAFATNPVGTARDAITGTIRDAITAALSPSVGALPHDPRLSKGGNSGGMTTAQMQTPYTAQTGGVTDAQRFGAATNLAVAGATGPALETGSALAGRGLGVVGRTLSRLALPADIMDGIPVDAAKFPAPAVRQDPMAALAQRFQAMDEDPRTLLPPGGKFGRPWPAPPGFTSSY